MTIRERAARPLARVHVHGTCYDLMTSRGRSSACASPWLVSDRTARLPPTPPPPPRASVAPLRAAVCANHHALLVPAITALGFHATQARVSLLLQLRVEDVAFIRMLINASWLLLLDNKIA